MIQQLEGSQCLSAEKTHRRFCIKQGSDISRVLYFFLVGDMAILTNGFIKNRRQLSNHRRSWPKKYKADYEQEILQMSRYSDFKKKSLENPEIREAYDTLQPEYDIIQAIIDARKSRNMTQKELSEATGITQADIS